MSTFDTARAATYDQGANAAIIGHDALYEVVMAVLAGHSMRRVLVLGAGTGKETIMLRSRYPQLELVAVDPSEPMLEVAREKLAAQGLTADVRCGYLHQFDDLMQLDAVIMIGVLHHLDSPQQQQSLLRQVGQRLSPGGLLIAGSHVGPLSDPLRRGAWEERWREYGASEDEMQSRREKVDQLVALQPATFDRWLSESGFGHRERIFSSLFFEVWAAQAGSTRVGTTAT